jgi:hypothetical protein
MVRKKTFIAWLRAQNKRDDIIGDLARDVIADNEKPRSLKAIKDSMAMRGACDNAYQALNKALLEYHNYSI